MRRLGEHVQSLLQGPDGGFHVRLRVAILRVTCARRCWCA